MHGLVEWFLKFAAGKVLSALPAFAQRWIQPFGKVVANVRLEGIGDRPATINDAVSTPSISVPFRVRNASLLSVLVEVSRVEVVGLLPHPFEVNAHAEIDAPSDYGKDPGSVGTLATLRLILGPPMSDAVVVLPVASRTCTFNVSCLVKCATGRGELVASSFSTNVTKGFAPRGASDAAP